MNRALRDSNMELVRIVAMSLILIYHFFCHAITPESLPTGVYGLIYPFVSCGVNLFFMLSGYFQVKLSIRSLTKLIIIILTFNIVNILLCFATGNAIGMSEIVKQIIFPISRSYYWFIAVYLGLIITSPLINAGLQNLSQSALRHFILIFSLFTFISCGIGHNYSNPTGYSYLQAVYMYCLAYWLRKDDFIYRKISQKFCIAGYIIILALCGIACSYYNGLLNYVNYNSFPIIAASALIFIFFTRIHFSNRAVNWMAGAALGCYLLQDGMFGYKFLYEWMHNIYVSNSLWIAITIYAGIFIGTWIASCIVSKIAQTIASLSTNLITAKNQ